AFGPIWERTIYDVNGSHPDDSFIDLDSGKLFSESAVGPVLREEDLLGQIQKTNIDLMGDASGQTFTAFDTIVLPVDEKFDAITAEGIAGDRRLVVTSQSENVREMKTPKELPATYLFGTREGGRGVLEVVRYNNDYESMDIRYKLVQADGFNLSHTH